MKKYVSSLLLLLVVQFVSAQKITSHRIKYYVGGLLYLDYKFSLHPEYALETFLDVTNTQNYNGKNYMSCRTCRYQNEYKVDVLAFQNPNYDKSFTLYIREIDKNTCILVFSNGDDDKMEIYYAKQVKVN